MLFHLKEKIDPGILFQKHYLEKKIGKNYSEYMEKFITKIKNYMDEKILTIDEVNYYYNFKKRME